MELQAELTAINAIQAELAKRSSLPKLSKKREADLTETMKDELSAYLGANAANECEDAADQDAAISVVENTVSNWFQNGDFLFTLSVLEYLHGKNSTTFLR